MEPSYNQTSANTTPHAHMDINISDFENNYTYYEDYYSNIYYSNEAFQMPDYVIIECVILILAFLGMCFSMYGLYSLVKTGQCASVYVINLFISDIVQTFVKVIHISGNLLCFKTEECNYMFYDVTSIIYIIGVLINVCFMVCISAERYIMIAYPVWYRNINTIKKVCVSVIIWIITVVIVTITYYFYFNFSIFVLLFLLLPYPLVVFFFVGTWRALSRNTSVPRQDQRRIMAILALVLCIYTVLFLPYVMKQIDTITDFIPYNIWYYLLFAANILIALNPLCDFLLYLLMRRDSKDILSTLFFCCHKRHEENRTTEIVTIQG